MPENPFVDPQSQGKPRRRIYESVLKKLDERWKRHSVDRPRMMQEIVNSLWDAFGGQNLGWIGFYYPVRETGLILGPHRDKPAPSPLSLEGPCGKALETKTSQMSSSELAVPVTDDAGKPIAVLSLSSMGPDGFVEEDRRWLERIVRVLRHTSAPTEAS